MSGLAEVGLVTFARELLLERIAAARKSIWLVSPFLTTPVAERIRDAVEQSAARERKLLTALGDRSVQVGVLDTKALSVLHEGDFLLASIRNLHAKVSIVDGEWGLVGSGNLTGLSLGGERSGNVELGVVLSPSQVRAAAKLIADWWGKAGSIDAQAIESYASLRSVFRDDQRRTVSDPYSSSPEPQRLMAPSPRTKARRDRAVTGSSRITTATTTRSGGTAAGSATGARPRTRSATSSSST